MLHLPFYRHWIISWMLFVVFVSLYFASTLGGMNSNDGANYALTQALVEKREVKVNGFEQWTYFTDYIQVGDDFYTDREPGTAVVGIPFYIFAKLFSPYAQLPFGGMNAEVNQDSVLQAFTYLATCVMGALTVVVGYLTVLKWGYSEKSATVTAISIGLGTLLWKYSFSFYREPVFTFFLLLTVYFLSDKKLDHKALFAAGMTYGWAIFTDYSKIYLLLVFGLFILFRNGTKFNIQKKLNEVLFCSLGLCIPMLCIFAYNYAVSGQIIFNPHLHKTYFVWMHEPRNLFRAPLGISLAINLFNTRGISPAALPFFWDNPDISAQMGAEWAVAYTYKGIFVQTPLLFLAIIGWMTYRKKPKAIAALTLGLAITMIIVMAKHTVFWGGPVYDTRYFMTATVLLMLGLGPYLDQLRKYILPMKLFLAALFVILGTFSAYNAWFSVVSHFGPHASKERKILFSELPEVETFQDFSQNAGILLQNTFPNYYNLPFLLFYFSMFFLVFLFVVKKGPLFVRLLRTQQKNELTSNFRFKLNKDHPIVSFVVVMMHFLMKVFRELPSRKQAALAILSVLVICTSFLAFIGKGAIGAGLMWLSSILLMLYLPVNEELMVKRLKRLRDTKLTVQKIFFIAIILLAPVVRIVSFRFDRIHQDEYIIAYISAVSDFKNEHFFAGFPANTELWENQFPNTFFLLQRMFFDVFGLSIISIKYSTVFSVMVVSLFVFLIGRKLFDNSIAVIATMFYAFFPLSIYLETLGVFISYSTAIFAILFYACLHLLEKFTFARSIWAGAVAGLCYLFYFSSYVALPFLVFVWLIILLKHNNRVKTIVYGLLSLGSFLVVFGPYLIFAFSHENYFVQRIAQVSIYDGMSSSGDVVTEEYVQRESELMKQLKNTYYSLYLNEYSGNGGYWSGRLALFNMFTLVLFAIGALVSVKAVQGHPKIILLWSVIVLSIITIVFSSPPPAFHRGSLAIPYLCLILALPFYYLPRKYFLIIGSVSVITYAVVNYQYFLLAQAPERQSENVVLANLVYRQFPDHTKYIAAYPWYHLYQVFYVTSQESGMGLTHGYHEGMLNELNPNEKYVYIFTIPTEFEKSFSEKDPNGKIIRFSKEHYIFHN